MRWRTSSRRDARRVPRRQKGDAQAVEAFVEGLTERNDESGEVAWRKRQALKKTRACRGSAGRHRRSQTHLSLRAVSRAGAVFDRRGHGRARRARAAADVRGPNAGVVSRYEALARWMVADRTSDVDDASSARPRLSRQARRRRGERGGDRLVAAGVRARSRRACCRCCSRAWRTKRTPARRTRRGWWRRRARRHPPRTCANGDDEDEEAFANDAARAFTAFDIAAPGAASVGWSRLNFDVVPAGDPRRRVDAARAAGARLLGAALVRRGENRVVASLPKIVGALIDAVTDDDKDTAERVLVARGRSGRSARDRSELDPAAGGAIAGDRDHRFHRRAAALITAAAAFAPRRRRA